MSFGIGDRVEVIRIMNVGRWTYFGERGIIEGRLVQFGDEELYKVKLETDNTTYTFAPSEIELLKEG